MQCEDGGLRAAEWEAWEGFALLESRLIAGGNVTVGLSPTWRSAMSAASLLQNEIPFHPA